MTERQASSITWAFRLAGLALASCVFARAPWRDLRGALLQVRLPWALAMVALGVLSVGIRSVRLWILLPSGTSYPATWRAVALGYFGSLVLPLGGGELTKMTMIRQGAGVPGPRALAAVALDRVFDLGILGILLAVVATQRTIPGLRVLPMAAFAAFMLLTVGTVTALATRGTRIGKRLAAWTSEHRWGARILEWYQHLHEQALMVRRGRAWPLLAACFAALLLLDYGSAWAGLRTFPFHEGLPLLAPVQVSLFIMTAFALPLLPGSVGTHQAACILALAPFGVPAAKAVAFSLIAQLGHVVVVSGLGLAALATSGLSFRGFKSLGTESAPPPGTSC